MSSRKPKYQELAESIITRIDSGEIPRGTFLPSERTLTKEFDLSRITVRSGLNSLVKQKYLEAVTGKGYLVLDIPQEPRRKTLNIGGLWCSGLYSEHTIRLFQAASNTAEENGYMLFLSDSGDDEAVQAAKLSAMLEKNTDGLLIVPTYNDASAHMTLGNHKMLTMLRKSGKPLVLVDRPFPETDLPCVVNDDAAGGSLAADHLYDRGHSKVLMLHHSSEYYITRLRFGSFRERCSQMKMEVFELAFPWHGTPVSDYQEFLKIRENILRTIRKEKITGIFMNLSSVSSKVIEDLQRLDLEFVVYDLDQIQFVQRPTTVIQRQLQKIAERAISLLVSEIQSGLKEPPVQTRVPPELVELPLFPAL